MFKYSLIAIAVLAGTPLVTRAEDQKTTNTLGRGDPLSQQRLVCSNSPKSPLRQTWALRKRIIRQRTTFKNLRHPVHLNELNWSGAKAPIPPALQGEPSAITAERSAHSQVFERRRLALSRFRALA